MRVAMLMSSSLGLHWAKLGSIFRYKCRSFIHFLGIVFNIGIRRIEHELD